MKIWEHKYVLVPTGETIMEICEERGREGWEPWHIARVNLGDPPGVISIYFKRQKES